MRKCVGKLRLLLISQGQAHSEKANLHARYDDQECYVRYGPQQDAESLSHNDYYFQCDPGTEDGQKDRCKKARTLFEDRPSEVEGMTNGKWIAYHCLGNSHVLQIPALRPVNSICEQCVRDCDSSSALWTYR